MQMKGWEIQAHHDYLHSGDSVATIAKRYGRSPSTLWKKITGSWGNPERLTPGVSRGGRKKLSDQKPISARHQTVGAKLNYYRTVTKDMNLTQLGDVLGTNRFKVRQMEVGVHDFTLQELETISEIVDIPVLELIKPPQVHS